MAWQEHLLRLMARGDLTPEGLERPDTDVVIRVLDRIQAQPELAARLDALDERGVRTAFLALYAEEAAARAES